MAENIYCQHMYVLCSHNEFRETSSRCFEVLTLSVTSMLLHTFLFALVPRSHLPNFRIWLSKGKIQPFVPYTSYIYSHVWWGALLWSSTSV